LKRALTYRKLFLICPGSSSSLSSAATSGVGHSEVQLVLSAADTTDQGRGTEGSPGRYHERAPQAARRCEDSSERKDSLECTDGVACKSVYTFLIFSVIYCSSVPFHQYFLLLIEESKYDDVKGLQQDMFEKTVLIGSPQVTHFCNPPLRNRLCQNPTSHSFRCPQQDGRYTCGQVPPRRVL
jgi:hypothetical protein